MWFRDNQCKKLHTMEHISYLLGFEIEGQKNRLLFWGILFISNMMFVANGVFFSHSIWECGRDERQIFGYNSSSYFTVNFSTALNRKEKSIEIETKMKLFYRSSPYLREYDYIFHICLVFLLFSSQNEWWLNRRLSSIKNITKRLRIMDWPFLYYKLLTNCSPSIFTIVHYLYWVSHNDCNILHFTYIST